MNREPILGLTLTILLAATLVTPAAAAAPLMMPPAANSQPKSNDAIVHDFVFGNGETLASLKLHYLTLGTPRRDASGAITNGALLLHGTAGSSADLTKAEFFDALSPKDRAALLRILKGIVASRELKFVPVD